jgi:hypothetical protein
MIRFNDHKEFLVECSRAKPPLVRITTLQVRDPKLQIMLHFFLVAGFRDQRGEVVELKIYKGSIMSNDDPEGIVPKLNEHANRLLLDVQDCVPTVEIRSGRYVEGADDEIQK